MPRYKVTFECVVTIEAKNADEAIRLAWLSENQNYNGVYKLLDWKKVPSAKEN